NRVRGEAAGIVRRTDGRPRPKGIAPHRDQNIRETEIPRFHSDDGRTRGPATHPGSVSALARGSIQPYEKKCAVDWARRAICQRGPPGNAIVATLTPVT